MSEGVRSRKSRDALEQVIAGANGGFCVSIGGGPVREHPALVNLNIAAVTNVDIVADAHRLPFADESVSAVHSEAVFEHLRDPAAAAREIARVLKPGGKAFICTPFLQAFHGHPSHYQNFTIVGHKTLFETAGLQVIEQGVTMGPTYALSALGWVYLREYAPRVLRPLLMAFWAGASVLVIQIDRILIRRPNAHILASATYLVAQKPSRHAPP